MLANTENTYLQDDTALSFWRVLRSNCNVLGYLHTFGRNSAPFMGEVYPHRVVNGHFIHRKHLTWIVGKRSFTP
jgi:hypothetical protein